MGSAPYPRLTRLRHNSPPSSLSPHCSLDHQIEFHQKVSTQKEDIWHNAFDSTSSPFALQTNVQLRLVKFRVTLPVGGRMDLHSRVSRVSKTDPRYAMRIFVVTFKCSSTYTRVQEIKILKMSWCHMFALINPERREQKRSSECNQGQ